jgi:inner membrane protein
MSDFLTAKKTIHAIPWTNTASGAQHVLSPPSAGFFVRSEGGKALTSTLRQRFIRHARALRAKRAEHAHVTANRNAFRVFSFCALLCGALFAAADSAKARYDFTVRMPGRSHATVNSPLVPSRRQLGLPPPHDGLPVDIKPERPHPFCQLGNPMISSSGPATPCAIGMPSDAEVVGNLNNSGLSAPPSDPTHFSPSNSANLSLSTMSQLLPFSGWSWLIFATILLILSMSGAVFLWFFGLAGALVGGISLVLEVSWQAQLYAFAVSGLVLAMLWQAIERPSRRRNDGSDHPHPAGRPSAFVGRVLELASPIADGIGMVAIDGTIWRVAGRTCAAGKQVKVVHVEGTLLIVEPLESRTRG